MEVRIVEPNDDPYSWAFDPADVTIELGATVVWRNTGTHVHTVTAEDGSFSSPDFEPGSWRHRFDAPGDSPYHCSPHPWMKAGVSVAAGR